MIEGGKEWGGSQGALVPRPVAPPPARLRRIGGLCAFRAVFLTQLSLACANAWLLNCTDLCHQFQFPLLKSLCASVCLFTEAKQRMPQKAFHFCPSPTQSGRQLTISNPPPASDAGLESQKCAATAMTSLFQSCGGF